VAIRLATPDYDIRGAGPRKNFPVENSNDCGVCASLRKRAKIVSFGGLNADKRRTADIKDGTRVKINKHGLSTGV
jgi:hypothetical protein